MGGLVPESYYFKKQVEISHSEKINLTVSYGGKEKLNFEVKVPGSSLQ